MSETSPKIPPSRLEAGILKNDYVSDGLAGHLQVVAMVLRGEIGTPDQRNAIRRIISQVSPPSLGMSNGIMNKFMAKLDQPPQPTQFL